MDVLSRHGMSLEKVSPWLIAGTAVIGAGIAARLLLSNHDRRRPLQMPKFDPDHVYLFQFGPSTIGTSRLSVSPFCSKVQIWLTMVRLPFTVLNVVDTGPTGKNPFIEVNGTAVGDSTAVLEYLSDKFNIDLDSHLSLSERAQALAFQRLIEEHLYFVLLYYRWFHDENFEQTKKALFSKMPLIVRLMAPRILRKKIIRDLIGQGFGKMTPEAVLHRGLCDLKALSSFLGSKPFLMGDKPSTVDVTLFSFLNGLLYDGIQDPFAAAVSKYSNLYAFTKRFEAAVFMN